MMPNRSKETLEALDRAEKSAAAKYKARRSAANEREWMAALNAYGDAWARGQDYHHSVSDRRERG